MSPTWFSPAARLRDPMEDLLGWRGPAKTRRFRRLRQEGSADELGPHLELIARLRRIGSPVREVADFDGSLENGSYGDNAAEFVGSYRRQPHGCNASTCLA